jgi:hypothetical protein
MARMLTAHLRIEPSSFFPIPQQDCGSTCGLVKRRVDFVRALLAQWHQGFRRIGEERSGEIEWPLPRRVVLSVLP